MDHKIPTVDFHLQRNEVYELLGVFLGQSLAHTGIAGVGLSPMIVDYLLTEENTESTPYNINFQDCIENYIRVAIAEVCN